MAFSTDSAFWKLPAWLLLAMPVAWMLGQPGCTGSGELNDQVGGVFVALLVVGAGVAMTFLANWQSEVGREKQAEWEERELQSRLRQTESELSRLRHRLSKYESAESAIDSD